MIREYQEMMAKQEEMEKGQNLSRALDVNSNTNARISLKLVYTKRAASRYADLRLEVARMIGD